MSKIVLISSGPSIAQYGQMLQKSLPRPNDLLIIDMYMEEALNYVRHYIPGDTDVIIARGNTAKLLKSAHLSVPVVTIPIRDSELIQSVYTARELYGQEDSSIAYLGLEDVIQSVRGFLDILHCRIRLYTIGSSQDIRTAIQRAKREQVQVVIGGIYTRKMAAEAGLDSVLLESSLSSVREAYERALEVQKAFVLQRKKIQERSILLNSTADGILSISEKGKITMCNSAAEKYLGVSPSSLSGKSFLPLFPQTEKELLQQSLLSGNPVSDHPFCLKEENFILSVHPIAVGSETKGSVVVFRPSEQNVFAPEKKEYSPGNSPAFPAFFDLTGSHPLFQMALAQGMKYARLSAPVLLIGEEGTGKETFARCIHYSGSRSSHLFISRESSLLTKEDLLAAHQGTLYLRNAHRLSRSMEELLTDILKTGSVAMENHPRTALDIRLIAGSDHDLSSSLSPELYYQINTLILALPALRSRASDIPLLAEHMVNKLNMIYKKSCSMTEEFLRELSRFPWPGNLRQLESYLRRLVILADEKKAFSSVEEGGSPDDSDFYSHLKNPESFSVALAAPSARTEPGFTVKGRHITYLELKELDRFYNGKKGVIAQKLGISRSTLWRYYREMEKDS